MIRLLYCGPLGHNTGYARAAEEHLLALHEVGVKTGALELQIPEPRDPSLVPPHCKHLLECVSARGFDPSWPTHVLLHMPPHQTRPLIQQVLYRLPPHVKRIYMTTWESTSLPGELQEMFEAFDQIWVPSTWNQIAVAALLPRNRRRVKVVPHPYDPSFWMPHMPADAHDQRLGDIEGKLDDFFTFYTVGTWNERKNLVGLLKAYLTEFTIEDAVALRIVTPGYSEEEMQALARSTFLPPETLPRVEFITTRLTQEELREVHWSGHVYVSASRSEGFGLGAYEAALVGNPVIAPDFGGTRDFLAKYPRYVPISGTLTPAMAPEPAPSYSLSKDGQLLKHQKQNEMGYLRGNQHWLEPNLAQLQAKMRAYYRAALERSVLLENTQHYLECMQDRFSHRAVGSDMLSLLQELKP